VIYRIEDAAEVVRIERVGPRREIYRPRTASEVGAINSDACRAGRFCALRLCALTNLEGPEYLDRRCLWAIRVCPLLLGHRLIEVGSHPRGFSGVCSSWL